MDHCPDSLSCNGLDESCEIAAGAATSEAALVPSKARDSEISLVEPAEPCESAASQSLPEDLNKVDDVVEPAAGEASLSPEADDFEATAEVRTPRSAAEVPLEEEETDSSDDSSSSSTSDSSSSDSDEDESEEPSQLEDANRPATLESFNERDELKGRDPVAETWKLPEIQVEIPELSATTVWRNKILTRGGIACVAHPRSPEGIEKGSPSRCRKVPLGADCAKFQEPRREMELSPLVSLKYTSHQLAREKLKMLRQYRAEGHDVLHPTKAADKSLPLLKVSMPGKALWNVQAESDKAALPGKAPRGSHGKVSTLQTKVGMAKSQSLPALATKRRSQGIRAAQQVVQARMPIVRTLDIQN
eukprot:g23834.t1